MNLAIVSVGSNIDPLINIRGAIEILEARDSLVSVSNFFRTKPEGFPGQPDFLNGAFYLRTHLSHPELKIQLRELESELGRIRTANKNGPRTIDLDIVVFNGEIVDSDYYRYNFVRKAVDEIFTQIRSKEWKKSIRIE